MGKGNSSPDKGTCAPTYRGVQRRKDLSEGCGGVAGAPDIYRGEKISLVTDLEGFFFCHFKKF